LRDRQVDEQAADEARQNVHEDTTRRAAQAEANAAYEERIRQINRTPAPLETIESEKRKASETRDAALRSADDAYRKTKASADNARAQAYADAWKKLLQAEQTARDESDR